MEEMENISSGDSSEQGISSSEAIREKSEKQKESYKKAQAQIQRAQKDEKRAKGDNDELFEILMRFIQNPFYESLVPQITELLQASIPSRPIIGMLALIYPDAAHHLFHATGQVENIHLLQSLYRYPEVWSFSEKELHESIRKWMSVWIDSFDKYLTTHESSLIMQKKLSLLIAEENLVVFSGFSQCMSFFFESRNINISRSTVDAYTRFMLKNIQHTLQKSLQQHPDNEILQTGNLDNLELFGL